MAQALDCPNFSGKWELRTSEKLDEYLKDEGWGLIKRKAAAAITAYQTIVQSGSASTDTIKITVENKVKGAYTYEAKLDGTEVKYADMDKGIYIPSTLYLI